MRLLLLLCAVATAHAQLRVLILTGASDLPFHDWRSTTPFLKKILEESGRFKVAVTEEPASLTAAALAEQDALVLNYNGPRWGERAERAVEDFLRLGKGLVAVHGVSYGAFFGMEYKNRRWVASESGDPGWRAYADMLGMTWKPGNIGHAKRHVFQVKWIDRQHPISRGLNETFYADDELYHRMDHKPNIHVLATAFDDPALGGTGKDEPVIWTVSFGAGRTVHITLGHDVKAMSQPGFITAFARSAEWAAAGAVR